WSFFKAKYHCLYPSDGEEKSRLRLFIKHLKYVILSNFQESNTYQLTLNRFSDWTLAEFRTYKTGAKVPSHLQRRTMDDELDEDALQISSAKLHQRHYEAKRLRQNLRKHRYQDKRFGDDWFYKYFNRNSANTKPNNTVDWRTKNVVSSVKNQGDCAFCYAFAATAVLESLYAIKTKSDKVIEFSPQQIVNCSKENGCNGGRIDNIMNYIKKKGNKIATDASYPYNYTEESCQINGINEIDLGEVQLETIPKGVFKRRTCESQLFTMDHAMAIIGYGYDEGLKLPYWIIKNSYGAGWGEKGYIRTIKDAYKMCGVAYEAYTAKLS
ncbi:unnamed protein product, partial [Rotaria sp. Silwood1]